MRELYERFIVPIAALALIAASAFAQESVEPAGAGEVIMLEAIEIRIAPELPTVVVTIPRQQPTFKPTTLQSPLDRMLGGESPADKPRLQDLYLNKIDKPQKILAKQRSE